MRHTIQQRSRSSIFRWTIAVTAAIVLGALTIPPARAQTETVLHNFDLGADGGEPFAGVTFDQQGRIYGTTSDGGTRHGVVYRLVPENGAWVLSPIYTFQGRPDGESPDARVLFGPNGLLYGTTSYGGTLNAGTVFSLRPPATACKTALCPWDETIIYSFTGGNDGGYPSYGDLIFDHAGNIYGTTQGGGANGYGVVFELSPSSNGWTETVLWNFTDASEGGAPLSGVILDNAGNLYGTTQDGGANGYGSVYELSPTQSGWSEKTLYAFTEYDNGSGAGGVVMDAHGDLFGITGNFEPGAAYELTPQSGGWSFTLLQTFNGEYPGPLGAPTLDAQGNLYGPLPIGEGAGEIFKLLPTGLGWQYIDYFNFNESDGYGPIGAVTFDASGNMYGTTAQGGSRSWGTVWEITP